MVSISSSMAFSCSSRSGIVVDSSFSFFAWSLSSLLFSPLSSPVINSTRFRSFSASDSLAFLARSAAPLIFKYSSSFKFLCACRSGSASSSSLTCPSISFVESCARLTVSCRASTFCLARCSAAAVFSEERFKASISDRTFASAF